MIICMQLLYLISLIAAFLPFALFLCMQRPLLENFQVLEGFFSLFVVEMYVDDGSQKVQDVILVLQRCLLSQLHAVQQLDNI